MTLLAKGVTRLSQLTIDADKDWAGMGISNIKEVALGMAEGDIIYRDATGVKKLTPGIVGSMLKTKGTDANPIWSFPDVMP